jgi:hypothetical protein
MLELLPFVVYAGTIRGAGSRNVWASARGGRLGKTTTEGAEEMYIGGGFIALLLIILLLIWLL